MKFVISIILLTHTAVGIGQKSESYPVRKSISTDSLLSLLKDYPFNVRNKVQPYFLPLKDSITDSLKYRLIAIVERKIDSATVIKEVNRRFYEYFEYTQFYKILDTAQYKAKILFAQQRNIPENKHEIDTSGPSAKKYQRIYDSVFKSTYTGSARNFKKQLAKEVSEYFVPDEIVFSLGVLKIKEATSVLKKDLESSGKHFFNKETAEIALAGLGDVSMQKKYIEQHNRYVEQAIRSNKKIGTISILWQDFLILSLVINTQESVSKLADWMDTTLVKRNGSGDDDGYPPSYSLGGAEIAPNILWFIKNKSLKEGYIQLPLGEGCTSYWDYTCLTPEQMLFLKEWLIKNKGKYEFD